MSSLNNERTGATPPSPALLVRSLEAQGMQYVFGIPGAKIDKVFDTPPDSKIQTIVCWHEQNAAFMAAGIGLLTSKAGVALVHFRARLFQPCDRPLPLQHRKAIRSWRSAAKWRCQYV